MTSTKYCIRNWPRTGQPIYLYTRDEVGERLLVLVQEPLVEFPQLCSASQLRESLVDHLQDWGRQAAAIGLNWRETWR